MGCELADSMADACALVESMAAGDPEGAGVLLEHGCAAGIALQLAGWLAYGLGRLDAEDAAAITAGWRQRAGELRERAC